METPTVPSRHFEIAPEPGGAQIVDHQSSNGTAAIGAYLAMRCVPGGQYGSPVGEGERESAELLERCTRNRAKPYPAAAPTPTTTSIATTGSAAHTTLHTASRRRGRAGKREV